MAHYSNSNFYYVACETGQIMERLNETSCQALHMNASDDGVCYNYTIPYGFWNMSLARNQTNTSLTRHAAEEFFQ